MGKDKIEQVDKRSVHYRPATGSRRCRNCIMFHTDGTCDLVKGRIAPEDVCDRWETRVQKDLELRVADLAKKRGELLDLLDSIELHSSVGTDVTALRSKVWEIRKEAYRTMVEAHDAGYIVAPDGFGWSEAQLKNQTLRDWLTKSEQTPRVSTEHSPLGREGLWHTPSKHVPEKQQLPAYIQNTAKALMRDHGMEESQAIATAINAVKAWAQGKAFGGKVKVTDEVKAAAAAALAEWEKLKESHHG